ncbi:MAG TPA: DUF4149 domain-containing protein [Acidobacteriaceae bacterium]|jgi:hypothetical protein
MTTTLRILRLLALAAWVGGLLFFVAVVARVAFSTLPDTHQAGAIVRGTLLELHKLGMICGAVYFFFTMILLGMQRDTHPARAVELALIVAMVSLTAYSQFSVMPSMERDRISLGGEVKPDQADQPAYKHFQRLHKLSEKLEGAVLIEGLILLALVPVHGDDDLY